jgi:hypothetical protein
VKLLVVALVASSWRSSFASIERDLSEKQLQARLTFTPFRNGPPCADGSPSGIYVEEQQQQHGDEKNQQRKQPRQHVIVFIGGGACTSPDDCREGYEMEPFKFTTRLNPISIRGDTILSQNASLNAMASLSSGSCHTVRKTFFSAVVPLVFHQERLELYPRWFGHFSRRHAILERGGGA